MMMYDIVCMARCIRLVQQHMALWEVALRHRKRQQKVAKPEVSDDGRKRLTISLSQSSVAAWKEIRKATDADSDSEVFRNALRLYLSLLRAHKDGKSLFIKDKNGEAEKLYLFLAVPAE